MTTSNETFASFLADLAERFADAPALSSGLGDDVSYACIDRVSREAGESLRQRGLAASDRIAVVVSQEVSGMMALLASAAAMGTMPLREQITPDEARGVLARAGIRALLAPDSGGDGAREAAASLGIPVLRFAWRATDQQLEIDGPSLGPVSPPAPPAPGDIALMLVTSGTTGRPRIVPWTQSGSIAGIRAAIVDKGLGPGMKTVLTLPIALGFGAIEVFVAMASGTLTIIPGQIAPTSIRETIRRYQPDWMSLAAAHYGSLAESGQASGEGMPALRWVASGGAPLRDDLRDAAELILGCPVLNLYGASEAGPISKQPFPVEPLAGAAGRPLMDIRVVDDDENDLPPGSAGRLLVLGPSVFPGYLDDPDATARAFTADGWLRTGDRAIAHPDGSLSILGRGDDLINRGGDKIDPIEVQTVLNAHPAVLENAVFAIPHARLGSEPAAVVVLRPGHDLSLRDARRWLIDRLSPHKVPRRIAFIDAIPRTPSGKIHRAALPSLLDHPSDR